MLEHDPDHIDARLDLARSLRRLGKLDEAIAQTRSAFDRAAQPLDIAEELFWLLCEADDRQAAIDLLTLLDDDRSDADALARSRGSISASAGSTRPATIAPRIAAQDPEAGALASAEIELAARATAAARDDASLAIPETSTRFANARRIAASRARRRRPAQTARSSSSSRRARAKPRDLELALVAAIALADAGIAARRPRAR